MRNLERNRTRPVCGVIILIPANRNLTVLFKNSTPPSGFVAGFVGTTKPQQNRDKTATKPSTFVHIFRILGGAGFLMESKFVLEFYGAGFFNEKIQD